MEKRLFIAIPLSDTTQKEIFIRTELHEAYRITRKENLHITLFFIGEVSDTLIEVIEHKIDQAASRFKPFEVNADHFGGFPEKGLKKIIYASGTTGLDSLNALAEEIKKEMNLLGFHEDKDFRYHITVGRLDKNYTRTILYKNPPFGKEIRFKVSEITLYRSDLDPSGPVYTPIFTAKLSGK